jgi:hypothetical protein
MGYIDELREKQVPLRFLGAMEFTHGRPARLAVANIVKRMISLKEDNSAKSEGTAAGLTGKIRIRGRTNNPKNLAEVRAYVIPEGIRFLVRHPDIPTKGEFGFEAGLVVDFFGEIRARKEPSILKARKEIERLFSLARLSRISRELRNRRTSRS